MVGSTAPGCVLVRLTFSQVWLISLSILSLQLSLYSAVITDDVLHPPQLGDVHPSLAVGAFNGEGVWRRLGSSCNDFTRSGTGMGL